MKELEILISSQEEQEKRGNLTEIGISYLNGLRTAMKIVKNISSNHVVSGSALSADEKTHYECLQECCNKILSAIDRREVPSTEINGLRVLMGR